MTAVVHNVAFDAREPRVLARFWSDVTGYQLVDDRDGFAKLRAPDHNSVRQFLFLGVDQPSPGKSRVHVDLAAREPDAEVERLLNLGASLVDDPVDGKPQSREANGIKWVVLRDPEGNEFCVGGLPSDESEPC